uniref:Uncharacterized LOC100176061 n=1 Tax=Ciona intestinalis TaxID=7719 RepID=F6RDE0_CIOIN|nr:uncharacterized protein LOC100176061 [Ciona intestinalis]|eukprot:XP_002125278.1 uncharacterized protein LOC100176061 [Ciona intestinalis]
MDFQDAEKTNCSSIDVIKSVSKKWKFYFEIRRREDGFDPSPSYIPRRLFPNLLPRPMLMQAPQDVSLKHHFTHAQVRCALANIQSYQPHVASPRTSARGEKINRNIKRMLKQMHVEHPMWHANQHDDKRITRQHSLRKVGVRGKGSEKALKKSMPVLLRASPPYLNDTEKQRLLDSTCEIILGTERIGKPTESYMEIGNTKLQSHNNPTPLQYNFTVPIHRRYVEAPPRIIKDSTLIHKGRSVYVYDQHGRRNKVVVKKDPISNTA